MTTEYATKEDMKRLAWDVFETRILFSAVAMRLGLDEAELDRIKLASKQQFLQYREEMGLL